MDSSTVAKSREILYVCIFFSPVRLIFLWVGETKDPLFSQLEARYFGRIERFLPAERLVVKETKKTDPHQVTAQLEQEARRLDRRRDPRSYLVALDEGGKLFSSVELSEFLSRVADTGQEALTFVVGGHSGLPQRILGESQLRMSLGRMTLPHELARVVLLEQVYRALSIARGTPYHK